MDNITQIIVTIFASGGVYTLIQFFVSRYDNKKRLGQLVSDKIDELAAQFEEYRAIQARVHILRFSDDLKNNIWHSQEFYRQLLCDLDTYEKFCASHPEFKNGMTVLAAENIRNEYKKYYLQGGKEE